MEAENTPQVMEVPIPTVDAIRCRDPREACAGRPVSVIAFYYPGREEPWDTICNSGVLGNFFPLPRSEYITFAPPKHQDQVHTFTSSEAAYQAVKFWDRAADFAGMTAQGCYNLKKSLAGKEDNSCGGLGSVWASMRAVLELKFRPGSQCAAALLATQDSFLVEHNNIVGRDVQWSDDRVGSGRNWLGLLLMLQRDALTGRKLWTEWAADLLDLETGLPKDAEKKATYQAAITEAATAILAELAARGF